MNDQQKKSANNPQGNQPSSNPADNQAGRQIKIADNIPGAEYSNFMQVNHSKEEFQLFFGNVVAPSGRIVSKVITAPGHFKRMLSVMQDNLKKYEEQFGEIEAASNPDKSIGFQERK